ncbi:MAG: PmoA family protein [Verrucomicrobia bacterium]|nr:PmoA family protein [Verrucomicrobiota bacterium]
MTLVSGCIHQQITGGYFANDTVRRAVDGCLACILGREAAARHSTLTMEALLKANRRLEVALKGLKAQDVLTCSREIMNTPDLTLSNNPLSRRDMLRRSAQALAFVATATVTALCFVPAAAMSANAPAYRWKTEKDSLSLLAGDQVVYTCHFAAEHGYPYIHPVSLPGGPVMSALAPVDHPWHRGLWFSWKFLNGADYWECLCTADFCKLLKHWKSVFRNKFLNICLPCGQTGAWPIPASARPPRPNSTSSTGSNCACSTPSTARSGNASAVSWKNTTTS